MAWARAYWKITLTTPLPLYHYLAASGGKTVPGHVASCLWRIRVCISRKQLTHSRQSHGRWWHNPVLQEDTGSFGFRVPGSWSMFLWVKHPAFVHLHLQKKAHWKRTQERHSIELLRPWLMKHCLVVATLLQPKNWETMAEGTALTSWLNLPASPAALTLHTGSFLSRKEKNYVWPCRPLALSPPEAVTLEYSSSRVVNPNHKIIFVAAS